MPEVVRSLDFAFGLGSRGVAQGDFVKAQGAAELGKGLWLTGEEEGMVIDVKGQRQAVLTKGGWEEVEMSREVFALVDAGSGDQAAVVIDEAQKRRLALLAREPAMRRGIVLPELADVLNLPAADWTGRILARTQWNQTLSQSPSADRGAMQGEAMAAEHLGSREAVRTGRNGAQELAQRIGDGIGKGPALIAPGGDRSPTPGLALGTGREIRAVEFIKTGATQAEFRGGRTDRNLLRPKTPQHIAHKRSSMTGAELLVVFIAPRCMETGASADFPPPSLRYGCGKPAQRQSVHL